MRLASSLRRDGRHSHVLENYALQAYCLCSFAELFLPLLPLSACCVVRPSIWYQTRQYAACAYCHSIADLKISGTKIHVTVRPGAGALDHLM